MEAPWHDCWAHQCQEAIDLVEGTLQSEPISDAQHGRKVQEVMMALFESARQRQRIDLPLKTRVNPLGLMVEQGDLPVAWPGRLRAPGAPGAGRGDVLARVHRAAHPRRRPPHAPARPGGGQVRERRSLSPVS